MTPAAHIQAAIEIVQNWLDGSDGLDKNLARWTRAHRFAGSKDRAAIADHVYGAIRRLRSAGWVSAADVPTGRDILRGHLLLDGKDPGETFSGQGYAPAALRPDERRDRPLKDAPKSVRLDIPDWLIPVADGLSEDVLTALRHRADADVRVNLLKATVKEAIAALAADGIEATAQPLAQTALRITEGARKLANCDAYKTGLVEIQDAASQAVAEHSAARPGETVLDLCAGGGGKSLALAAAMRNQGRLMAYDVSQKRLAQLPVRAKRAGARITLLSRNDLQSLENSCDLVLVDAPCSGSGAWRRNPDAKWRLTQDALDGLTETQGALLDQAADLTAENGRIAYVTCSLFDCENSAITSGFLVRDTRFELVSQRQFTPLDGADGFFVGILQRR